MRRAGERGSYAASRSCASRPIPISPGASFSEAQLQELSESIRRYGLLSPVVVRRAGEEEFQLIAGERRLRACKMLHMERIDALILPAFEQDAALIALIENLQREQLNCFEEAEAYAALIQDHGLSQEELAHGWAKARPPWPTSCACSA